MTIQRGPELVNVCVFDTADYCTAKEEMKCVTLPQPSSLYDATVTSNSICKLDPNNV